MCTCCPTRNFPDLASDTGWRLSCKVEKSVNFKAIKFGYLDEVFDTSSRIYWESTRLGICRRMQENLTGTETFYTTQIFSLLYHIYWWLLKGFASLVLVKLCNRQGRTLGQSLLVSIWSIIRCTFAAFTRTTAKSFVLSEPTRYPRRVCEVPSLPALARCLQNQYRSQGASGPVREKWGCLHE